MKKLNSAYKSIYHRIWDKDVRYYFMNNYCQKAQDKYLPDYVFNLNKEQSIKNLPNIKENINNSSWIFTNITKN